MLVYALLGPLWFGIAAVAWRVRRSDDDATRRLRTGWTVLAVAAVGSLVPMFVTLDETRVYGLVTAPMLVGAAGARRPSAVDVGPDLGSTADRRARGRRRVGGDDGARPVHRRRGLLVAVDLPPGEFARFLGTATIPATISPRGCWDRSASRCPPTG